MNYSELREALLKLKTTEDLKQLFAARKFPTDENIITLNDNGDYAEIVSYSKPAELDALVRRHRFGRQLVIGLAHDASALVFARMGYTHKYTVQRYRVRPEVLQKNPEHVALSRILSLKYNDEKSWNELFERQDISKRFYAEFRKRKFDLVQSIVGVKKEDARLFATVLLNRLLFLYFLQKKRLLNGEERYLNDRFVQFARRKKPFYSEFLKPLFFESLCVKNRSRENIALTGEKIPYLNGGLFLPHEVEERNPKAKIDNRAFEALLNFFESWVWHTSEGASQGDEDAIDPYVLGYIFERTLGESGDNLNKEGGVYYTPPSLSNFLARETLLNYFFPKLGVKERRDYGEHLQAWDEAQLVAFYDKLRSLSLLDPACGSGQFLVVALHLLAEIHLKLRELAETKKYPTLQKKLIEDAPAGAGGAEYAVRRFVVAHNLYGVDLLPEAVEIAKLRLFLGMIEGLDDAMQNIEPLPNLDFNLRAGNSLVGFRTFAELPQDRLDFDRIAEQVAKRQKLVALYRDTGDRDKALKLRHQIEKLEANLVQALDTKFDELANEVWKVRPKNKIDFIDLKKDQQAVLAIRRHVFSAREFQALHWPLEFATVMPQGFDIILTNPPWDVLEPNSQEFFELYIEDFRALDKQQAIKAVTKLFAKMPDVKNKWIKKSLAISALSDFVKNESIYPHQGEGKVNMYKVFLERCYALLKEGGALGMVIPSGLYTDKGCTELRRLLFENTSVGFLYAFENREKLFEEVDSRFKFILLNFCKLPESARENWQERTLPCAFMLHSQQELAAAHGREPESRYVEIPVRLLPQLSGETLSLMEFKSQREIELVKKIYDGKALLGETLDLKKHPRAFNVRFTQEFNMTSDSHLFYKAEELKKRGAKYDETSLTWHLPAKGKKAGERFLPLYEGNMIHQFDAYYEKPRYWVAESEGRKALLGKEEDTGQILPYQEFRIGFRDVASNTNERTWIVGPLPECFTGNTLIIECGITNVRLKLFLIILLNSFLIDYIIRYKVTSHVNIFYTNSVPLLREIPEGAEPFLNDALWLILHDARTGAPLPAFQKLPQECGLSGKPSLNPPDRQRLRNRLDAWVAKLYGLTRAELEYILSTFPLVKDEIKQGVLEEFDRM